MSLRLDDINKACVNFRRETGELPDKMVVGRNEMQDIRNMAYSGQQSAGRLWEEGRGEIFGITVETVEEDNHFELQGPCTISPEEALNVRPPRREYNNDYDGLPINLFKSQKPKAKKLKPKSHPLTNIFKDSEHSN